MGTAGWRGLQIGIETSFLKALCGLCFFDRITQNTVLSDEKYGESPICICPLSWENIDEESRARRMRGE
jgi:hypothetical protein